MSLMMSSLVLSSLTFIACESNEVVSRVLVDIRTLDDTLTGGPYALNGPGELTLTPYDLTSNTLYNSVSFDLAAKEGEVPALPLGRWRFLITGQQGGESLFGMSAPFDVDSYEGVSTLAIVGKSQCTGLLPALRGPDGIEGTSDLVRPYDGSAAIALPDGRVLVLGGGTINAATGTLEMASDEIQIYDPRYGIVSLATERLSIPRAFHRATLLNDGRVLITGGVKSVINGQYLVDGTAEVISVNGDGSLSNSGPITMDGGLASTVGRYQHMQQLLSDGTVLIAGGLDTNGPLSSSTRFFPQTNLFVIQGPLSTPRVEASISLLKRTQEKALISGGFSDSGPLATTEIFTTNPSAGCAPIPAADGSVGCFTLSAPLNRPRWGHNSALLEDGSILILGGFQSGDRGTPREEIGVIEQFKFVIVTDAAGNPTSANITVQDAVGLLASTRGRAGFAVLREGNAQSKFVLLGGEAGGSKAAVSVINTTNLSQGISNQVELTPTCPLSEDRYYPMTVTTAEGAVMVLGGIKRGDIYVPSRRIEMIYPQVTNISLVLAAPTP
jgi:hypothetical protein